MQDYPWENFSGHPKTELRMQTFRDGHWASPRAFAGWMRYPRVRGKHRGTPSRLWTWYRADRRIPIRAARLKLRDILPPGWVSRDPAYVRWWIEYRDVAYRERERVKDG